MHKDFPSKPSKVSNEVSFYRKWVRILLAVSLSLSVFQAPVSAYALDDDTISSEPSSNSILDPAPDPNSDITSGFAWDSTPDTTLESHSDSTSDPTPSPTPNPTSDYTRMSAQIDFVYIDEVKVGSDDDQSVVVGFAEGALPTAAMTLICVSLDDGQEYLVNENNRTDKSVLFTWGATNQILGSYSVSALEYQDVEGTIIRIDLSPDDDELGAFDVVESFSLADDGEDVGDIAVYSIDESGEIVQSDSVEEALDIAVDEKGMTSDVEGVDDESNDLGILPFSYSATRATSSTQSEFVIALDPGHGGSDPGASAHGIIEKEINLKIAQYCKEELEKTSGVKVVMTRTSDVYVGLEERVEYAVSQGADVFVSIHNNTGGGAGFEVWYPNRSSYLYEEMHVEGQGLANSICDELEKLGLYNRGSKMKSSTTGQYYPDGSVADHYSIIRNSRTVGLLGIIIEHAFLDNASDASKLKDEKFLRKLGMADATGILSYYADEIAAKADTVVGVWVKDGDDWYFRESNGSYVSGFQIIGGKKYYFGPSDGDRKMRIWWFTDSGRKYWADSSGAVSTGWVSYGAKKWYLNPKDGGAAASGFFVIYDKKYYFDPVQDCTLQTDWFIVSGKRHWADGSGVISTGWMSLGGDWWYLNPNDNGAAASGFSTVSGKRYYFGPADGDCKMRTDWFTADGKKYWANSGGVVSTGWMSLGGDWWYLNPSDGGAAATGFLVVSGTKYYFGPASGDCKMRTSWFIVGNKRHWANNSGAVSTGWMSLDSAWWYLDPNNNGAAASGFQTISGKKYYFGPASGDCKMRVWWFTDNGKTYWANGGGVVSTGWVSYAGDWWYLDPNNNGAAASGFQTISGKKYYFGPASGDCKMRVWWFTDNGKTYWANGGGVVSTGWVSYGAKKWYLDPDNGGAAASGWKKIEGYWYYFNPNNDSCAVTGWVAVNGTIYKFDNQGRWTGDVAGESIGDLYTITGSSSVTAPQMAQVYKSLGKQYPSTALSKGGASSIDVFCTIIYEEALAEGIRPEVVFVQAMNETGWLQFGGDVKIEQFNFCGLGATGNGVPGLSFVNVRTGIRAHVQHLKAYANTEPLNNTCVDSRFGYVERGCAPYVEWLGIQENPFGKGWAARPSYGYILRGMITSYFGI